MTRKKMLVSILIILTSVLIGLNLDVSRGSQDIATRIGRKPGETGRLLDIIVVVVLIDIEVLLSFVSRRRRRAEEHLSCG